MFERALRGRTVDPAILEGVEHPLSGLSLVKGDATILGNGIGFLRGWGYGRATWKRRDRSRSPR